MLQWSAFWYTLARQYTKAARKSTHSRNAANMKGLIVEMKMIWRVVMNEMLTRDG